MKSLWSVLLLLSLLTFICCVQSTQRHPQCPGNLQRVSRVNDIDFRFGLVNDQAWHQYPEMYMKINLPFGQWVKIFINMNNGGHNGNAYTVIRLIIDKKQQRLFRAHGPIAWHNSHQQYGQVWLQKGMHQFKLQYRSREIRECDPSTEDWSMAYFRIDYLEPL